MKILVVVFAIFQAFILADATKEAFFKEGQFRGAIDLVFSHFYGRMHRMEEHCSTPAAKINLQQAINNTDTCLNQIPGTLSVCEVIKTRIAGCIEPLFGAYVECIEGNMEVPKFMAGMGMKSTLSVFSYICDEKGSNIMEIANPCLYEKVHGESFQKAKQCVENGVFPIAEKYKKKLPKTKEETCVAVLTLWNGFWDCFQSMLYDSCPNPRTKTFLSGLRRSFVAPCEEILKDAQN